MKYWQVDAFATQRFHGNPAAVVVTDKELDPSLMQNIAMEINQSETAFVSGLDHKPQLRWFTPQTEVDLCGHATLSAAHILFSEWRWNSNDITFETQQAGPLKVTQVEPGTYTMDFPSRPGENISLETIPQEVVRAIHPTIQPIYATQSRDLMLVYESEKAVREFQPNFSALNSFDQWIIVTAKSNEYDFVSRFFCAGDGISEDPVTGSAHCTLTPYWAHELSKSELKAYQVSQRGGELLLALKNDRVAITGSAVTVMKGQFT